MTPRVTISTNHKMASPPPIPHHMYMSSQLVAASLACIARRDIVRKG